MTKQNLPAYLLAALALLTWLLALTLPARGDTLTAVTAGDAVTMLEKAKLEYKGHALLFGSGSFESCIYAGDELLALVHYCYPQRPVPARAVSLWSKKLGVVELYEETLDASTVKRDVRQNEFPELVQFLFPIEFRSISVESINSIMSKLYERRNPGCWSTNFDWNEQKPVSQCLYTDIALYPKWAADSQKRVSEAEWNKLFKRINKKLGLRKPKP